MMLEIIEMLENVKQGYKDSYLAPNLQEVVKADVKEIDRIINSFKKKQDLKSLLKDLDSLDTLVRDHFYEVIIKIEKFLE